MIEGIQFDTTPGISLEEQQEIAAEINAMSGTGSRIIQDVPEISAKKKGYFFPLIINAVFFFILGLGFLLLYNFHLREEQSIRDSSMLTPYGHLIREIRLETDRIIGDEERARLLAMEELSRLSSDRDQINRIEDHLSGLYITLNSRISFLLFDEASATIAGMREFLNLPLVLQLGAFNARRQTHLSVIAAMEEALDLIKNDPSMIGSSALEDIISELTERNTILENERQNQQTLLSRLTNEMRERDQQILENNSQREELLRQNTELQNQIDAIRALLVD
ncbi:MAG: hypothetical protein FWG77_00120 [Treponema sp.]|nr:hypothetical protein [Treponema sp.]